MKEGKAGALQVLAMFTGITGLTVDDLLEAKSEEELCTKTSEHIRKEHEVSYSGCHADKDGDCIWSGCPQLLDGEPTRSGRHCPLDFLEEDV
jgi:hypothetical protein